MTINRESLKKILFYFMITAGLVFSNTSYADVNSASWTKSCSKNNCIVGINSLMPRDSDGKQGVAATIQIEKGVTEEGVKVTVIKTWVPLNVNLTKYAQIYIDEKFALKLIYRHCNSAQGCKATLLLNEELINKFKKGKNVNLIFYGYGTKDPYRINFPLKNFTKAYKEL